MFAVCALMSVVVLIGGCSVIQSCRSISAESDEFERRRDNDIEYIRSHNRKMMDERHFQMMKDLRSLKFHPTPAKLQKLLDCDQELYSSTAHHSVRFAIIVKSVCRQNGKLPSLSDLRFLTHAAESARPSVWRMRVAISVLLIVGILGTLVGIHGAIASGIESGARAFPIEKLQPALLPSSIAVLSTIVLIIMRGFYQRRVNRYIGRLDRHTISCYFSILSPPAKVSIQLREVTGNVEDFSAGLQNVLKNFAQIEHVPDQFQKQSDSLELVRQDLEKLQATVLADASAPDEYAEMHRGLNLYNEALQDKFKKLRSRLNEVKTSMEKTTTILLGNQIEVLLPASEPFSKQANSFRAAVTATPVFDDYRQNTVKQHQVTTTSMQEPLKNIVGSGLEIQDGVEGSVNQAAVSAQTLLEVVQYGSTVKSAVEKNKTQYESYRGELDKMYHNAKEKLESVAPVLDEKIEELKGIYHKLMKRIEGIEKEPTVYWYELVIALVVIVMYGGNIYLTLA